MNTKKKNKNRPKVPKVPQQTESKDNDKEESLDNVTLKSEVESVIKEDIMTQSSMEDALTGKNISTCDVPKKPKRNKSKKKQETIGNTLIETNTEINKADFDTKTGELQLFIDNVVSKNASNICKNKNVDETQVVKELETNVIDVPKEKEENKNINIEKNNLPPLNFSKTYNIQEQETKVAKNKKKKRNHLDSEKSDIIEGCTSTFQKLMQSKEDEGNLISTNEGVIGVELTSIKIDNVSTRLPIGTDNEKSLIKIEETDPMQNLHEVVEEEKTKGKKKNKKNKQQHQKLDELKSTEIFKTEKTTQVAEISHDPGILSESNILVEDSKSTPKIIKPVEKKRNVKTSKPSTSFKHEKIDENQPSSNNTSESFSATSFKTSSALLSDKKTIPESIHDSKESTKSSDNQENVSLINPINIDIENQPETVSETTNIIKLDEGEIYDTLPEANDDMFMEVKPAKKKKKHEQTSDKQENISLMKPVNIVIETRPESLIETTNVIKLDEAEIYEALPEAHEDMFKEVKPAKKNKKKSQQKYVEPIITVEEEQNIIVSDLVEVESLNKVIESDIEMVSCNTCADPPECNFQTEDSKVIVPDLIQYPMSSSHHALDSNNNNTVIQEISTPEEIKLGIPILTPTPIIQGSGETPEIKLQEDPLKSSVIEIEEKLNTCVPEKTDIKSKMMEVSQDMEDLRLSIERSLAEFTSLDKKDKEYEDKNIQEKTSVEIRCEIDKRTTEGETHVLIPMPSNLVDKQNLLYEERDIMTKSMISESKEQAPSGLMDKTKKEDLPVLIDEVSIQSEPPICPSRKDNKGKGKTKKKGKQEVSTSAVPAAVQPSTSDKCKDSKSSNTSSETQSKDKENEQKQTQPKGKQQSLKESYDNEATLFEDANPVVLDTTFEPIEHFEDALTSSIDDVNKSFEMIASQVMKIGESQTFENPEINIIAPIEDDDKDKKNAPKENPVSRPKNLLGHPDIPVQSNKTDYKKEKNKYPNNQQAKVIIKDSVEIEKPRKSSKQSQTCDKRNSKNINGSESYSYKTNEHDEFIYKYSFRKVHLQSSCHVCKKDLLHRYPCKFCSLISYCSQKHMDEDWPQHQSLCFAVSTISHLKDQKHIYADAKGITGQDYRILRMQMIVSCEKMLKRKLAPWEQEAFLYPRICNDNNCREWRQEKLKDCDGCSQISYCADQPNHLSSTHQRWCKSYALYKKLVNYQQTRGRLEPPMPSKILEHYKIPDRINDILASMFEEKIDINDIQYAALTQLATAPLTVAFCHQLFTTKMNSTCANGMPKKSSFTIHAVGAELQFEADGLNKWEAFFLHLRPDIKDLRIILVGPDLNPSNLPLELLAKIKLCESCQANNRRVLFNFQDKATYHGYYTGDDFILPDIVCAFNPSIQRASIYNGRDSWPSTVRCVLRQKIPFILTAYTLDELERDLARVKEFGDYSILSESKRNPFASVRPDRNFITDHEIPLLFKNYCFSIICGV